MQYTPTIVAQLCYSRGWRDKNLITMVAIVGAETNYTVDFNDGVKYGLFGMHLLDEKIEDLLNPEYSAKIARERYERKFFAPWISYATGKYYNFVKESIGGVSQLYLQMFEAELHG